MQEFVKQVTTGSDKKHTTIAFISGAQVDPDNPHKAYVSASTAVIRGKRVQPTGHTQLFEATPGAFARVLRGTGSAMPSLQEGLIGLSRYNFIFVLGKKNSKLQNVHAFPDGNYVTADWSAELKMPVQDNEAIVQLFSSGDIDVMAFPSDLYTGIRSFIEGLESMETVDSSTSFTFTCAAGPVTARVTNQFGNRFHFICRLKKNK